MATRAEVLAEMRSSGCAPERLLWRNQTLESSTSEVEFDPIRNFILKIGI